MAKKKPPKPPKPYKDFPLYAHGSGYWAKRINGRIRYFGQWSKVTWKDALAEYMQVKDALYADRDPWEFNTGLTVEELCNQFLTSKERLVDSGELGRRSFNDYFRTCSNLINQLKSKRSVPSLLPDDFEDLRAALSKRLGFVSLGNEIGRIRVVFKYAYDAGLISQPVRYGPHFKRPGKRQLRVEKNDKAEKLFSAKEIRKLLKLADEPIRTMILLGINCGLGNADCGRLKTSNVRGSWLNFPRPKTGVDRRANLWPETVAGVKANIASRKVKSSLVFLTKYLGSWHKDHSSDNPISKEFRKLMIEAKLHEKGRGFYALRHTFETEAGATLDQPAVDYIMGHEPQHMSSVYRHGIQDDRLQAVSEHMFRWLFGEKAYGEAYLPKSQKPRKA